MSDLTTFSKMVSTQQSVSWKLRPRGLACYSGQQMLPYVFIKSANLHINLSGPFLRWVVRHEDRKEKLGQVCKGDAEELVCKFREEHIQVMLLKEIRVYSWELGDQRCVYEKEQLPDGKAGEEEKETLEEIKFCNIGQERSNLAFFIDSLQVNLYRMEHKTPMNVAGIQPIYTNIVRPDLKILKYFHFS